MSTESDAYVEKRKAWGQATANVDGLIAKLKVIEPLIANWRVHYLGPPWGFPQIYAKGRTAVDARGFPTLDDIHNAMVAAYKAEAEMNDAWAKVPQSEKGLTPPPSASPAHSGVGSRRPARPR
jgi:hypothetical protein